MNSILITDKETTIKNPGNIKVCIVDPKTKEESFEDVYISNSQSNYNDIEKEWYKKSSNKNFWFVGWYKS